MLSRRFAALLATAIMALALACGDPPRVGCETGPALCPGPVDPCAVTGGICDDDLKINELMAKNDSAWIDPAGETDDWIELVNTGSEPLSLLGYSISDTEAQYHFLPPAWLDPGEVILLWADDEKVTEGNDHLPFRLSSAGEVVFLWAPDGRPIDRVSFPASEPNDAFARFPDGTGDVVRCRFATPGRSNGDACEPPPPPELPEEMTFLPYTWPAPWPPAPAPLALSELALRPASFIEVINAAATAVDLTQYSLTVSAHAPGLPWPTATDGVTLSWPTPTAAPGERVVVPVDSADVTAIAATTQYEGVVTVWDVATGLAVDRVDFMAWPDGATLARTVSEESAFGRHRFCSTQTPGATNEPCAPLLSRPIPESVRHLYTPGDFDALSFGGTAVSIAPVKFVVDMEGGDAVHLLNSADWGLHYTWVREMIDGSPHLDRCDATDNSAFYQGWAAFSQQQYFQVDTRRYLLGSLVHHTGSGIKVMEFATGDQISPPQIERTFFAVMRHIDQPLDWSIRPEGVDQVNKLRQIEGGVPIVEPNAPFRDVTVQLLSEGIAYGILQFVRVDDLYDTPLGQQVVLVTDQVPNDIPLVGGLITETFQTPLSHVNVLSRNRGTPNMALRDARSDTRVAPLLDTLVRYEVKPGGFEIRAAGAIEAQAYWDSLGTQGPPLQPRLDTSVRGLQHLTTRSLDDLPALGGKAAQLAQLARVDSTRSACLGPVNVPRDAVAIPVVHSLEHYDQSGAAALLAGFEEDPLFVADPRFRAEKLADVRAAIMAQPVDATLLAEVETYALLTFGTARVRFRSSSNVEDLPGFNGAGLYTSISGAIGDPERLIEDAIRTVWASLFNARAYDERSYANVDPTTVAMGILVHEAFQGERVNAVAISRNILEPIRSDIYYMNAQAGEASVVNPAPGITTDQLIYRWGRLPRIVYFAESNLPAVVPVMSSTETERTACTLRAIHDHFRPLLDPMRDNRWFAMDIELKLLGPARTLLVKQARPYSFGNASIPADCREF
ncbi:MAG: lamin tail domain-containing protein [Myxococcota bacterium]